MFLQESVINKIAEQFGIKETMVRDISCGRTYKCYL